MADPLELRATPHRVRAAARAANLTEPAVLRAVGIATETPAAKEWREFLARALALFGAGLLLAGVVCFVAYNWARIGRYGKFALVEIAIVAATLLAWKKLPKLSGQIALLGAAVLVGPLLAIYGQTYQTGADPYGLFLTWCALIIPWAVLGNFAAIWVLALLLLDVSLVLFYAQVLTPTNTADSLLLPLLIAALHAVAICAWEWQIRRDKPLMDEDWALRLIAVSGFVALFIPAAVLVFQDTKSGIAGLIGAVGLWGAVAGTMYYYRRVRPDRFMVVLAATAAMAWITVVVARLIFDILDLETFGMILMAAFVIWEITFGLKWYRRTRAS